MYYYTFMIFVLLLQLLMSFKVVLTLEKCSELIPQPANGRIEYRISKENKTIAVLSCNNGYIIDGNDSIECDDKWSHQIGTCVESTSNFKIDDLNNTEKRRIPTGNTNDVILRALDNSSGSFDSEDDAEVDEDDSNYSDASSDNNNVTNGSINSTIVNNGATLSTIIPDTTTGNSTNNNVTNSSIINGTTFSTMTPDTTTGNSTNNNVTNSSIINGTTLATMIPDTTTESSTTIDSESSSTSTSDSTISSSTTNESVAATGSSSTNTPATTIGGNIANNNDTVNSTVKPFQNAGIRNYVSCFPTILVVFQVSILFINYEYI